MLNQKYRATRLNIGETMKTGIPIWGDLLYAKISRKEAEKASFAIIISKKNEKTSVGRHRIKRKITGYIEKDLPKINLNFKKTVVFLIKQIKKPINYKEIEKEVGFIMGRL